MEVFTVEQAAAVGVTLRMLQVACEHGWVCRLRYGVYVLAGASPSRWRPVVAAALAAGPESAISHGTAATIHQFHGIQTDKIELILPLSARRNLQDVCSHRSSTLVPTDIQVRRGLRVTTPVRTIIDIADRFQDPLLGLILDEGTLARLWTPEEIGTRLEELGRAAMGVKVLRRLLSERTGEGHPDSRLEQRVIRVVKPRYSGFVVHHREVLEGKIVEIDLAWLREKVAGEVDGMRVRTESRSKFEHERLRLNLLQRHGWRIVHFTDKMDDATILAQLAPLLGG
jgi:very-short-patch-repair endonuclease